MLRSPLLLLGSLLLGVSLAPAASTPLPPVPYTWRNVQIGGGGFVTGLVFHPTERGLYYARTDVGGAYRWDDGAQRWIPLTDWLGMDDWHLTGIDGLALDPSDPERVYLAAGIYNRPEMPTAALLRSADRGATWQRTELPFKLGGNEAGRGNGERLAVDPHDGRILFLGSRDAGLWRSADRAATWSRVDAFPAVATSPAADSGDPQRPQMVGIVWILFDARSGATGQPTPTLYAAVSTRETSLFRSTDAGTTWQPVPGQPLGFRPTRAALTPAGTLYLAYGNDPGPNTMTDGAVWKFDTATGIWIDITPARGDRKPRTGFGYGAVTFDPAHPDTLLASTFCHFEPHDEIYRSTDAGRTWRPLLATSAWDHANAPWTEHHTPHWTSDVKINPFDSDHALFTTGYGIWASRNLAAADAGAPVNWWFQDTGLEETVPLGLISPPVGPHLVSALGDLDGYRHDELDRPQLQFTAPPRFANSESIAFAGRRPEHLVRVGTIRQRTTEVRAAWSADSGATWAALASEPPGSAGAGVVALSADAATIVWTPRGLPKPGATGWAAWVGEPLAPQVTRDRGVTWTASAGLPAGAHVIADPVAPQRFYAYDADHGTLFVSTDGAAHFAARATDLPRTPITSGPPRWRPPAGLLYAAPARSGELWLASRDAGLFRSVDGGATFAPIAGPVEAYSLGFGAPAPGRTNATLYLAGKIGALKALFRSDDSGATWLRINDDAQQFGSLGHVTGDPRLFGRVYFATGGRGIFYGDPAPAGR